MGRMSRRRPVACLLGKTDTGSAQDRFGCPPINSEIIDEFIQENASGGPWCLWWLQHQTRPVTPGSATALPATASVSITSLSNFALEGSGRSGAPALQAARDGLRCRHGQHQSTANQALRSNTTPACPAAGVPGLQARSPAAHRDRPLRGAARVLGCGHRDRLDLRADHSLSRAPVASGDEIG